MPTGWFSAYSQEFRDQLVKLTRFRERKEELTSLRYKSRDIRYRRWFHYLCQVLSPSIGSSFHWRIISSSPMVLPLPWAAIDNPDIGGERSLSTQTAVYTQSVQIGETETITSIRPGVLPNYLQPCYTAAFGGVNGEWRWKVENFICHRPTEDDRRL